MAEGGEALAGGEPEDAIQVDRRPRPRGLDRRRGEQRAAGDYDGVGRGLPIADLLARSADGVGSDVS